MTRSRNLINEPSTQLGLLGVLLASGLVCVHVPVSVWSGNRPEFDSPVWSLLAIGVVSTTAISVIAVVALSLLTAVIRTIVASALCAAGIVAWSYAYLLAGGMAPLDGRNAPMDFGAASGWWELPLVAVVTAALAAAIARMPRIATIALVVLNVALFGASAIAVLSAGDARRSGPHETVFRFSPDENVLVIVLDGLQSGIAEDILSADATLTAAFDGFQLYRDTVSAAPTTFLSLPAIHSGEIYEPRSSPRDYFIEAIERRSFMNRFAEAGYDTALVNPVEGVCPAAVETCTRAAPLLRSSAAQLKRESLQLLDLSLFRVLPVMLKSWVYDQGRWRAAAADVPEEIGKVVEGIDLLEQLARRLTTKPGRPTLKFLHSFATHTPYVLDAGCHVAPTTSIELATSQARCALGAVARLLERLRRAGIYDNTVILIAADHGINPGVYGAAADARAAWVHTSGAANPVFLLKRHASRGLLRAEPAAVHLADVTATLCSATGACTTSAGMPAGEAPHERARRFNDYAWRHEFWRTLEIPSMTAYDIRGAVWDMGAWKRAAVQD